MRKKHWEAIAFSMHQTQPRWRLRHTHFLWPMSCGFMWEETERASQVLFSVDFCPRDLWLLLTTHFTYQLLNSLQTVCIRSYKCFSCSNQTWPFKYIKLYTRKLPTRLLEEFSKFNSQIFFSPYYVWNTTLGTEDTVINKRGFKPLQKWSF